MLDRRLQKLGHFVLIVCEVIVMAEKAMIVVLPKRFELVVYQKERHGESQRKRCWLPGKTRYLRIAIDPPVIVPVRIMLFHSETSLWASHVILVQKNQGWELRGHCHCFCVEKSSGLTRSLVSRPPTLGASGKDIACILIFWPFLALCIRSATEYYRLELIIMNNGD